MNKEIIWGIIGCGDVTERKSGPAFNKIAGSKIQMVMRRNAALAEDYAKRHHIPEWTSDADVLIRNKSINAIYIATPPSSHSEYAIKAMRAGKAVYVEKPMANTVLECEQMIKVSKETDMPLFVAYYRRSLPGFVKVKELINKGEIGEVICCNMRLIRPALDSEKAGGKNFWRLKPEVSGGGLFFDLASHQFDFIDYLLGPIQTVNGFTTNRGGLYEVEDTISASYQFANGIVGSGIWSFVSSSEAQEDIIEIIGSKGKISIPCFEVSPVKLHVNGKVIDIPFQNPEHIQYNLIQQVVETLQGKGTCVSTGESAIRTNIVLDKIMKGNH